MKKIWTCILCVLIVLCMALPVMAAVPPVVDKAGLLTDQQQGDLNTYFGKIRQTEDYGINVLTTDSLEGKSAQDYTEDFFDDHIGGDGVLLMVNLQESWWYISTNGECAQRISDSRADQIGKEVIDLVRQGQYYEAFYRFGTLVQAQMAQTPSGGLNGSAIWVCLIIGLAAAGITTGIMAAGMKTVRSKSGAADYVQAGSLHLTKSHDIYLYSTLSKTPRPKSNGSSSAGRSRGGSGGRI